MSASRTRHAVPVVPAAEVIGREGAVVIDLRAPVEYAEDHLPGAVNVPLLDDVARSLVGRLYGRVSPQAAFEQAREIVRERLGVLVREVFAAAGEPHPAGDVEGLYASLTAEGLVGLDEATEPEPASLPARPVVLHCWRGGLRSRSVVALVRALGMRRAVGLERGYKGYREHVREELERWSAPPTFVLRGLTGVGKTLVLRELERQRPGWTLDLEALAGHRSSILGSVGLQPVSQKAFDSAVALRLRAGFPGPVVLEGESRKVGDVIVPASLWRALQGGTSIELTAATARRVQVLVEDYLATGSRRVELRAKLPFLENRLGSRAWAGRLVGLLDEGRDEELTELLLEHYYDPLYRHSETRHAYATTIDAGDPARAASEIASWIEGRLAGEEGAP